MYQYSPEKRGKFLQTIFYAGPCYIVTHIMVSNFKLTVPWWVFVPLLCFNMVPGYLPCFELTFIWFRNIRRVCCLKIWLIIYLKLIIKYVIVQHNIIYLIRSDVDGNVILIDLFFIYIHIYNTQAKIMRYANIRLIISIPISYPLHNFFKFV